MNVVLLARCKRRGLRPTEDNLKLMRDQREGFVLGRMYADKRINETQFNAGQRFEEFYSNWAKSAGMPRVTAKASSYGLAVPGRDVSGDDAAQATEDTYFAAANALISAGMMPEFCVRRICLEDNESGSHAEYFMECLRSGLDALAKHFG